LYWIEVASFFPLLCYCYKIELLFVYIMQHLNVLPWNHYHAWTNKFNLFIKALNNVCFKNVCPVIVPERILSLFGVVQLIGLCSPDCAGWLLLLSIKIFIYLFLLYMYHRYTVSKQLQGHFYFVICYFKFTWFQKQSQTFWHVNV
jgi:hypothetical protein